jgi:hypothetical protein
VDNTCRHQALVCYPPCERERSEDVHDSPAQLSLCLAVIVGHVQRVAEHVLDLIPVHNAHPLAPLVGTRSLQNRKLNVKVIGANCGLF